MIRHLLMSLWNDKKSYLGILIEQALVIIILMVCSISIFNVMYRYFDPGLLKTDHVITFGYMFPRGQHSPESVQLASERMDLIVKDMETQTFIESVTQTSNFIPYLRPDSYYQTDTVVINNQKIVSVIKGADEYTARVYGIEIVEGEWNYTKRFEDGSLPAIITAQLAEELNDSHAATGQKIYYKNRYYTIVGVISGAKQDAFTPSPKAVILPVEVFGHSAVPEFSAKVGKGQEDLFYTYYYKKFADLMPGYIEPTFSPVKQWKDLSMSGTSVSVISIVIITAFFLLFAFIGSVSLYWLHAQKRIREFSLLIALGSTKKKLSLKIILESVIVSICALVPALVLFFHVYEQTYIHFIAMAAVVGIMFLFSVFSAWYPAWRFSRIDIVEALKYE